MLGKRQLEHLLARLGLIQEGASLPQAFPQVRRQSGSMWQPSSSSSSKKCSTVPHSLDGGLLASALSLQPRNLFPLACWPGVPLLWCRLHCKQTVLRIFRLPVAASKAAHRENPLQA